MSAVCLTCRGAGSLWTPHGEWWSCPACGGAGVRFMFGPPVIVMGTNRRTPSIETRRVSQDGQGPIRARQLRDDRQFSQKGK